MWYLDNDVPLSEGVDEEICLSKGTRIVSINKPATAVDIIESFESVSGSTRPGLHQAPVSVAIHEARIDCGEEGIEKRVEVWFSSQAYFFINLFLNDAQRL